MPMFGRSFESLGTIFALSNAFNILLEYDEVGAASPSNGVGGSDVECEEALGCIILLSRDAPCVCVEATAPPPIGVNGRESF